MTDSRDVIDAMDAAAAPTQAQTTDSDVAAAVHAASQRAMGTANLPAHATAGKGRRIKTALKRVMHAATPQQADFNMAVAEAIEGLRFLTARWDQRLAALEANSTKMWGTLAVLENQPDHTTALRATLASHDVLLEEVATGLAGASTELDQLVARIGAAEQTAEALGHDTADSTNSMGRSLDTLGDAVEVLRGDTASTRAHLEVVLDALRGDDDETITRTVEHVANVRRTSMYARFEDRFRGTRDQVLASFEPYEHDIARLARFGSVVDIGSGRGEWLQHLTDRGIDCYGVDTNSDFVDRCVERGFDVRREDALDHLRSVPDGSLGAVTGFHLVEHLPTDTFVELLDLCLVALAPGGRILFETPNPTNLMVGAASFYLDPTHLRPIHPDLLGFLATDRGFVDVEIRYVHPARPDADDPHGLVLNGEDTARAMHQAMYGPRDIAVLASRPGKRPGI